MPKRSASLRRAARALALVAIAVFCSAGGEPARPASAAPKPQDGLLPYIPARAHAAILVRRNAIAGVQQLLDDKGERAELSSFLLASLGVDLTTVESAVIFSLGPIGNEVPWGAFLRIPGDKPESLKLLVSGSVEGVPLYQVDGAILAARVPDGIVLGTPAEVRAAVTLAAGREPALAADSPLGRALLADLATVDIAFGFGPGLAPQLLSYGVSEGVLRLRGDGTLTAAVHGDVEKLRNTRTIILGGIAAGVAALSMEKEKVKQTGKPLEGAAAILGYHQVKRLQRDLDPRIVGDELVLEYKLPPMQGSAMSYVGVVGVLAAVAIPAFMKYIRRSKTLEAVQNLRKLTDAASALVAESSNSKTFTFPKSTGWTPAAACCGQPDNKCAPSPETFTAPSWQALHFNIGDPSYYQYRIISAGKGARATITFEARADLDCDGEYSLFTRTVGIGEGGAAKIGDLGTQNEIE